MRINPWSFLGAERLAKESGRKLGTVALVYFIQGSPPAILWEVLPVYFRIHGVSLKAIGGLRLLELPYSLKVFWSPLVHRYGDRRVWVVTCMLAIAIVVGLLPFIDVANPGLAVVFLLLALTTLSATQDVAIDSYTVGLVSREEEGAANGVRASAKFKDKGRSCPEKKPLGTVKSLLCSLRGRGLVRRLPEKFMPAGTLASGLLA